MKIKNNNSNLINYEKLNFIDKKYTEICYKYLIFKTPNIDYCQNKKSYIY